LFNDTDRAAQLNFIALALGEMGASPMLEGQFWHPIKNPFSVSVDRDTIEFVARRLRGQYGETITLRQRPFAIVDGVLTDPEFA
jgi:hypothetical protein